MFLRSAYCKARARIFHRRSPVAVCPSPPKWKHRAQSRNRRTAKRPKTAISSILPLESWISKRQYLTLRERNVRSPQRCNSTRQNEESHRATPIFLLHIFPKTPQLSHQTRLLLFITPLVSPFSYARVRALSEFAFFAFTLHLNPQPTEKQILAVKISVKFCLHRGENRIQRSKTISAMNSDIFKYRRCIVQEVKANSHLAFTPIPLTNRNLYLLGEEVKAKIENSWTRVRARFGGKDMIFRTESTERRKNAPPFRSISTQNLDMNITSHTQKVCNRTA